jgi:hypothetical protein
VHEDAGKRAILRGETAMADVIDFQKSRLGLSARLTLSEKESEILKWKRLLPFVVALRKKIVSVKKQFDADDEVLVRALQVLVESFEHELEDDCG